MYCADSKPDKPNLWLNILALVFPLAGLVVYVLYRKKAPVMVKSVVKWAIVGVLLDFTLDAALIAFFWNL